MSLSLLPVDDRVSVSGQLEPENMKEIAAAGFTAVRRRSYGLMQFAGATLGRDG